MKEDSQREAQEKIMNEDKRIIKREKLEIGERITYEVPDSINKE